MQTAQLSERQQLVYDTVKAFIELHGYAPSLRNIAEYTDINSTSLVSHYLRQLARKGYLTVIPNVARGIVLKAG